jgi:hypothetical protein
MCREDSRFVKFWSPESLEQLKRKGCGRINCRSGLSAGNPVETEIRQILRDAFGPAAKKETAGTDTGAAITK